MQTVLLGGPGCENEGAVPQGSATMASSATAPVSAARNAVASTTAASPPTATATAAQSAPAPKPGEGPIAKLLGDALANPKTYNGKPVKVEGVLVGTTSRNIGALVGDSYTPHPVVDVLVADSKDDTEHAIWCEMNKWVPPPGLKELDAVTAEGKGYMDLPAAGVKLVIGSCTLTAKAP